jgi:hypothetical protein
MEGTTLSFGETKELLENGITEKCRKMGQVMLMLYA